MCDPFRRLLTRHGIVAFQVTAGRSAADSRFCILGSVRVCLLRGSGSSRVAVSVAVVAIKFYRDTGVSAAGFLNAPGWPKSRNAEAA